VSLLAVACEKVPLLAPTGSTITLSAGTNVLAANGSIQIVAQVLEAAGTPPHSGTEVTFTTTLGTVAPVTAKTDVSGRAVVTFAAGGANGTATIIASSGGATTGSDGAVKISVGTAAVGRIDLTANPTTISATGGVSTILAIVRDTNGNALPAAPVSFATSAGVLSNTLVNTDANGNAQTTLSTSIEATVTATVGVAGGGGTTTTPGTGTGGGTGSSSGQQTATVTVKVNPLPTVSISAPSGTLAALSPVTFTIGISQPTGSTAQIRSVIVTFGDGDSVDMGAAVGSGLTVQHSYESADTYTVRVTVTDTLGAVTSAATTVVIQPQTPIVALTYTSSSAAGTTTVNFTATVTPSSTPVAQYVWNFGDGGSQTTTNNTISHNYSTASLPRTATVTITTATNQTASSSTSVTP
jgi:adhesin/invasin